MDEILKGVLKGARLSVDYSIQKYKDENDIKFIEVSIEGLNEMIASVEDSKQPVMDDFLMAIKGMRDELNTVLEDHKKK